MTSAVGLDISITGTGLASSAHTRTHLIGRKGLTTMPVAQRVKLLDALCDDIMQWIIPQRPSLVGIEEPPYGLKGAGMVERHYLYLAVIARLAAYGIPVVEINSSKRIKYALGKGSGSKTAIADAVARRFPEYETGGDDNRNDAVVIAAMCADHLGYPIAQLPQSHRDALTGIVWPTSSSS